MKILITAGNTLAPVDRVRCLTNIFTGRTGALVALEAHARGHEVTLLTSRPDVLQVEAPVAELEFTIKCCLTFSELSDAMERAIAREGYDAIVHSAAVNDFQPVGAYAVAGNTAFRDGLWESTSNRPPELIEQREGKISSDHAELWLRLVRTPKLVDRIRGDWGFRGLLVKFKLEVDCSEQQLLARAERSRQQSDADLMVANRLEDVHLCAYIGPLDGDYERVDRSQLASRLVDELERLYRDRQHG